MESQRQRQLLASLASSGQQAPIIVVAIPDQPDRYLVIDGYKRIAALQQLGRDTVEAVGLADERSPGSGAGPFAALFGTRECPGTGLVARGAGATVRLRPGGTGPTVRSQSELGVPSLGLGRATSRQRAATSARGRDPGAGGDEVFGTGGAWQCGRHPLEFGRISAHASVGPMGDGRDQRAVGAAR